MLGGLNDKLEHAHELGRLLRGRAVTTVNLIPYQPGSFIKHSLSLCELLIINFLEIKIPPEMKSPA